LIDRLPPPLNVICMTYHIYSWKWWRGRHGHDRMIVGFTTTSAIIAYHH